MKNIFVFLLFLSCLLLKVSVVAGASTFVDSEPFPIPSRAEKMTTTQGSVAAGNPASLTPVIGSSFHRAEWSQNQYTLGAILEVPLSPLASLELEGNYGGYARVYSNQSHSYNQIASSLGGKFYLLRHSFIRPYVGMGVAGIFYEGMHRQWANYNSFVGNLQMAAGTEVGIMRDLALGVRGEWLVPIYNRPQSSGYVASRGFEDASAVNAEQLRLLGTVKVSL